MSPALIFDCDGVLADTELHGHLPAFNETFADLGVPLHWDPGEYGELLQVGGGKERMRKALTGELIADAGLPGDEAGLNETIADWHRHKSAVFRRLVDEGAVRPRSGVRRLAAEALDAGWMVAVASTSAQDSVRAVLRSAVGNELSQQIPIFAGDLVSAKKPAPDIYLATLAGIHAAPESAVAVEDSRNGLRAATAAGLPCVVARSAYTQHETMTEASIVVSELGDPGQHAPVVEQNRTPTAISGFITLENLEACLRE
jgi:HAD superfamily hydrolase (TIGR01509 family)